MVERHALQLVCLGLLALSLAGLLYLTQASALVATMTQIEELQQQKQRLQRKQGRLQAEIARYTTPERIRERALELGFEIPERVEYLPIERLPVRVHNPGSGLPATAAIPTRKPVAHGLDRLRTLVNRLLASMTTTVEAGAAGR